MLRVCNSYYYIYRNILPVLDSTYSRSNKKMDNNIGDSMLEVVGHDARQLSKEEIDKLRKNSTTGLFHVLKYWKCNDIQ